MIEAYRTCDEALRLWAGGVLTGADKDWRPPTEDHRVIHDFLITHGLAPCLSLRLTDEVSQRTLFVGGAEPRREVALELTRQLAFKKVIDSLRHRNQPEPLVFKGQALAHWLYEQPWHRPRSDIDALVDKRNIHGITAALEGLGYEQVNAVDGELIVRQILLRKYEHGLSYNWDIHWSITNRPAFDSIFTHEFLRKSGIRVQAEDVTFITPSAINSLLIACIHLIGHHIHDFRLIWLYDIYLLAETLTAAQRRDFLNSALTHPEVRAACHGALALTQRYMPSDRLEELAQLLDPGAGSRVSLSRRHLSRLWHDTRAVGPGKRLPWLKQHLFPSPEYMTHRFGIRYRWQLPFWYAIRIGRAIPKLFRRR